MRGRVCIGEDSRGNHVACNGGPRGRRGRALVSLTSSYSSYSLGSVAGTAVCGLDLVS